MDEDWKRLSGIPCTMMALPDCGHSPHKDQEATVHTAITDFIRQIVQ